MENTSYGITPEEKAAAAHCLEYALGCGASQVRVSLNKSVLDTFMLLNGELDKVTHCADRSVFIYLFVDGRYGTYSTNRLDRENIEDFVRKAIDSTRMLAEDEYRKLPQADRMAEGAVTGRELGLYDREYELMSTDRRLALAMSGTIFKKASAVEGYEIISEECEYSDSIDDNYVIDSQGFEGRHTETSFAFWTEMTISGPDGHRYSGYHWSSSPFFDELKIAGCSKEALQKAADQINPRPHKGGKLKMVVRNTSSSRLISPIFSALNASAIQQRNSFLENTLGKKIFPEELTVIDMARTFGKPGSRLFDTEGVATCERAVIDKGVIGTYFVNTWSAGKMGIAPTIEGISRPVVTPFVKGGCNIDGDIDENAIIGICGEGILVTGFNGGNCNPTTGNFSYGIEGFAFKDGRLLHPVKEMVVTGNMISLWSSLVAAGSDALPGTRWQIPTLAFDGVDFSA